MPLKPKPTLRTLADETGLAVTTVSRALNNAPEIASATRQRVKDAALKLGYKPDRAAQRLKTGKTKVIAFILEPHDEMLSFGTRIIAGIMSSLRDTDYHLVVMPQFREFELIESVSQVVQNQLADGLIFCRTRPFDERVKFLLQNQFPFVTHGRTELASPHAFVDFDNFEFSLRATRKLLGLGRRKVALIGAPSDYTYNQHILHGFMTAIRETGAEYEVAEGVYNQSAEEKIRSWVSGAINRRGVDGIVCSGESALLAVLAAMSQLGFEPGKNADIVFKQTTPLFEQVSSKVYPIFEDLEATGIKLGTLLLNQLENRIDETIDPMEMPID